MKDVNKLNNMMRKLIKIERITKKYKNYAVKDMEINGRDSQFLICINHDEGMTQEKLAERLCIDKSAVTRRMTSLTEKGYVERKKNPDDKRSIQLFLTEKSKKIMPEIRAVGINWNNYLLSDLTDEEQKLLDEFLEKVKLRAEKWQELNESDIKTK